MATVTPPPNRTVHYLIVVHGIGEQRKSDKLVRLIMGGTPVLWAALLAVLLLPDVQALIEAVLPLPTAFIALGLALLVSIDIARIYFSTHKQWKTLKQQVADRFSAYAGLPPSRVSANP